MQDKTQQGSISTYTEGGVARITFFHPSHNSLPGRLLKELTQAIQNAGADSEVKVIILEGAGDRTFCAGASFDELMAIANLEEGKAFFMGFANVINAIRTCPKFVIGRVQGKAVGGGVGLAASVDYCLATKYAAIKLSELAIGIGPFVVGPAVARKMGQSAFQQLAINATDWQNAYWAREKGLYMEVYDSAKEMDAAIEELSWRLAQSSPAAMEQLKRAAWAGTEDWDELLAQRAAISGELVLSDHSRQALQKIKAG